MKKPRVLLVYPDDGWRREILSELILNDLPQVIVTERLDAAKVMYTAKHGPPTHLVICHEQMRDEEGTGWDWANALWREGQNVIVLGTERRVRDVRFLSLDTLKGEGGVRRLVQLAQAVLEICVFVVGMSFDWTRKMRLRLEEQGIHVLATEDMSTAKQHTADKSFADLAIVAEDIHEEGDGRRLALHLQQDGWLVIVVGKEPIHDELPFVAREDLVRECASEADEEAEEAAFKKLAATITTMVRGW